MKIIHVVLILCCIYINCEAQQPNYAKCAVITNKTRQDVMIYVTYTSGENEKKKMKVIPSGETYKFDEIKESTGTFDTVYRVTAMCAHTRSGMYSSQKIKVEGVVDCVNRTVTEMGNRLMIE